MDELEEFHPFCAIPVVASDSADLRNYCRYFKSDFQTIKDANESVQNLCRRGEEIVCLFPKTEFESPLHDLRNELGKALNVTLPSKFYRDRASLKNILFRLAEAKKMSGISMDNHDLLRAFTSTHPINMWIAETPLGETLLRHHHSIDRGSVGVSQSIASYYKFVDTADPFRQVIFSLPSFMKQKSFWSELKNAYSKYSIDAPGKYDSDAIEEALTPVREILKSYFKEKAFLFYPVDSTIGNISGMTNIRLFLYYEENIAGQWWGRNLLFSFSDSSPYPTRFIAQANYQLETLVPQSFLYEGFFDIVKDDPAPPRVTHRQTDENCMRCHLEVGKIKIGTLSDPPLEKGDFIADFKDAFLLSHSLAKRTGSEKLSEFRFKGESHLFPETLVGTRNGRRVTLPIYRTAELGPLLGSPQTPNTNRCFERLQVENCFNCHNSKVGQQGAIHWLAFPKTLEHLRKAEPLSNHSVPLLKTISDEMFMPYRPYEVSRSKNIEMLAQCLEEEYPKDYDDWIWFSLLSKPNP